MNLSKIEIEFLNRAKVLPTYPNEKIVTLVTENIKELGRLTALSFIEWVHENPNGVIALPTGKTPEYFIKYLKFFKRNWEKPIIKEELKKTDLKIDHFPATNNLKFVQLDEFFPLNPSQENSFTFYVKKHYLSFLQIKPENALLIDISQIDDLKHNYKKVFPNNKVDLSLLSRKPISNLEKKQKRILKIAQDFCRSYEEKIDTWGGIGFFLGGIGPDCHIAFNVNPSASDSITRLVKLNYPSQAAVAEDLGGIDLARNLAAITIGLGTITKNPNATIIIIAAGVAKSHQISQAIEGPITPEVPASALQKNKGARFYLTQGAAAKLHSRAIANLDYSVHKESLGTAKEDMIEEIIIGLALRLKKPLLSLNLTDFKNDAQGALLLPLIEQKLKETITKIQDHLITKIAKSTTLFTNKKILHTSPHHDDLILSYWPIIKKCLNSSNNKIVYFTSGFRGISDQFILNFIDQTNLELIKKNQNLIFTHDFNQLLDRYQRNYHQNKNLIEIDLLIFLKIVTEVFMIFGKNKINRLFSTLKKIKKEYLLSQYIDEKKNLHLAVLKLQELLNLSQDPSLFSIKKLKSMFNYKNLQQLKKQKINIFKISYCDLLELYQNESDQEKKAQFFNFLAIKILIKNLNIHIMPKVEKSRDRSLQNSKSISKEYNITLSDLKKQLKEELLKEKFFYHKTRTKIANLKSRIRELEAEREWHVAINKKIPVSHLRLHFYQGKTFNPLPNLEDDVLPLSKEIHNFTPDFITVAYDPEGTGPDTHYKALQVVAEAVKKTNSNVTLIGYRNIWHRFKFHEGDIFYPVTEADLSDLKNVFLNCFSSQKKAEFPSYQLDAPFSELAAKIQKDQLEKLKILLGTVYFTNNPDLKNAVGLVILKTMNKQEFVKNVIELKKNLK
ncbi:MAG: hypothetical protein WC860_04915 [Candidatus Margulisiibacteriota bacterium]|jgi:6-phosphogluconolactonase/glucosamine-6-phosphate isomerase/deaminase